ncbi:MAG TPA: BON domain-containing protein [Steroidobacteraceae bacterium]|nr:BON domain-containing protein [Steroidobacteraceae bacterium]
MASETAEAFRSLNIALPEEVVSIRGRRPSVTTAVLPQYSSMIFHTYISLHRSLCASALVLALAGALSGCALYNTYEKCGFHGCPGDAELTAEVRSRFRERWDLESHAITVQTLDHVVYLYCVVSSGLEIANAESIALQVPGVTRVVNSMAVSTAR